MVTIGPGENKGTRSEHALSQPRPGSALGNLGVSKFWGVRNGSVGRKGVCSDGWRGDTLGGYLKQIK